MRKMMNKKGFSLVELMIVVVIMGILIAVAIPLYGAITENANNKTCATNIETIKTTAANYYASYDQTAIADLNALAAFMDDGKIPACPLAEKVATGGTDADGNGIDDNDDYAITIMTNGSAKVVCPQNNQGTATTALPEKHNPEGAEASAPSGTDVKYEKLEWTE